MKTKALHAAVLTAGLLMMSAPALAHHGDAGRYDENPFVIAGTIVEIKMTNPHSILVFDATDADGKVVRWQAEMSGGQALARQFGWNKDFPKIGDKITLTTNSKPAHLEGYDRSEWVLLDYFDFVVHVFAPETRLFYGLERLWGNAERIER